MERTRFVEHRGMRILVLDYAGVKDPAEALREIEHSRRVVAAQPAKSLLVMTVVRDARYNAAVLQGMKELAAHNAPYVKASAVVGMGGLHRIAYQAVILFSRRRIQVFDAEAEALDWLAAQAEAEPVPAGARRRPLTVPRRFSEIAFDARSGG